MKKVIYLFTISLFVLLGINITKHVNADEVRSIATKNIMVYYRAWRDKEMYGVNTNLPDKNWMTMYDIPYGVNIVNVFSYVPKGEEKKAQPFFDKLKSDYVPYLHNRGVKLVRGFNYDLLLKVPHKNDYPTEEEFDTYAKKIISDLVTPWDLDGVDIDMETEPSSSEVRLSDGVIKALSKYLGPKANNGTLLFYDTNNFYTLPIQHVADCFNILPFQQYGESDAATKEIFNTFSPIIGSEKILPGLTFPEEQDHNRWYDTDKIYENSNIYKVAKYVYQHNLSGMFLYSFDRDGKTYSNHDLNTISPSDFLWTKTAILEANGVPLNYVKKLAIQHIKRISYTKGFSKPDVDNLILQINKAKNIRDVNMSILGENFESAKDSTYDPVLESEMSDIDLSNAYESLDKANDILSKIKNKKLDTVIDLENSISNLKDIIGGKIYTLEQVNDSLKKLNKAISNIPQPIVIKYLDDTGNKLSEEGIISGKFGEEYHTEYQNIKGYTFNKVEGNANGIFTEEPQVVKYIYTKNKKESGNVIVKYFDIYGKEIHKEQILKGNVGDLYDTTTQQYEIKIDGYTLDIASIPVNSKGKYTKDTQIVKYIYKKRELPTSIKHINNNQNKKQFLPSTGENLVKYSPLIGIILIIISYLVYIFTKKRL